MINAKEVDRVMKIVLFVEILHWKRTIVLLFKITYRHVKIGAYDLVSAFSPYHIGHFTVVGLKIDELVSFTSFKVYVSYDYVDERKK